MKGVADACRQVLTLTRKTSENAMEMLVLAQLCDTDEVRKQCYKELEHFTVAELKLLKGFTDLDEHSLRNVLLSKAERLEKCLERVLPQLCGLVDCVLFVWSYTNINMGETPSLCSVHYSNNMANTMMRTRINCDTCKRMFTQMAKNARSRQEHVEAKLSNVHGGFAVAMPAVSSFGGPSFNFGTSHDHFPRVPPSFTTSGPIPQKGKEDQYPYYSRDTMYFDENMVSILQEMFDLLKL